MLSYDEPMLGIIQLRKLCGDHKQTKYFLFFLSAKKNQMIRSIEIRQVKNF